MAHRYSFSRSRESSRHRGGRAFNSNGNRWLCAGNRIIFKNIFYLFLTQTKIWETQKNLQ